MPSELLEPSLKSLELLMLAQAQECFWQKASMGEYMRMPRHGAKLMLYKNPTRMELWRNWPNRQVFPKGYNIPCDRLICATLGFDTLRECLVCCCEPITFALSSGVHP